MSGKREEAIMASMKHFDVQVDRHIDSARSAEVDENTHAIVHSLCALTWAVRQLAWLMSEGVARE